MRVGASTLVLVAFLTSDCEETRMPIIAPPAGTTNKRIGDTVYVQQNPTWGGFNHPRAVIVGNEPFIYVADTDNDQVVMLDVAGNVIGASPRMRRPVALAEDKRLRLLVCAQFDTTLPRQSAPTTFGAIYSLDLTSVGHRIGDVSVRRIFYEPGDSTRRYTGVATMYDNSYYVCRVGPKNGTQVIDKDNAILLFSKYDVLLTPVTSLFAVDGTGLMSMSTLSAIATRPSTRSVEYVYCQTGPKALFKVQWIQLVTAGQTTNYISKFDANSVDLMRINGFSDPEGATIDPAGNVFVVDAAKDSLYRFSSTGVEHYSFGGSGSGERQFNHPAGVAYYDKTIYVADWGNNRIVRFKLSTDL